ncbi:MAG: hypothetical protein KME47_09730 [Nodosilinea sp. WJT8-NPBG4]|jgi:hypothetical protein|nr:hypothetical protein [Nodosilinea sp. WJT8-NPBG4]
MKVLDWWESTALRTEADDGKLRGEIVYIMYDNVGTQLWWNGVDWSKNINDATPMINDGNLFNQFKSGEPIVLIEYEYFTESILKSIAH